MTNAIDFAWWVSTIVFVSLMPQCMRLQIVASIGYLTTRNWKGDPLGGVTVTQATLAVAAVLVVMWARALEAAIAITKEAHWRREALSHV